MRYPLFTAALTFFLTLPSIGAEFPAIAPQVWAIKDEATQGRGALILESKLQVFSRYIEFHQRIRITSEAGKAAAEFPAFSDQVYDLAGQTTYPDGRVVPFTQRDFQTKTAVQIGTARVERTVVVPRGLTQDCVVDITWKESKPFIEEAFFGTGSMETWTFSEKYRVLKAIVEVPKVFVWNWTFIPGGAEKVDRSEDRSFRKITVEGIPAVDEVPYSVPGARAATRLVLYPLPQKLYSSAAKDPGLFWDEVGRLLFKPWFQEQVNRGRAYKALSDSLRQNLPKEPHLLASELIKRMDKNIRNLSRPTFDEKAKQTKAEAEEQIHSHDVNATAKRGATNAVGMLFLFSELLKDAGISPKLALVSDRDRWIFNPKMTNWQQYHDLLIGVEAPGKGTLWLDPGMRYAAPGLIHPDYQGTSAMVFETSTWKGQAVQLPVQPALFNQRRQEYRLELGEDEDQFLLDATFTGAEDYAERRRFLALEPREQNRLLKEDLERGFKTASIQKSEVLHTTDPAENVAWHVEGRIEREPGRRRTVDPFPVSYWAHWIPDQFPQDRKELIVFPHAGVHVARSQFTIPKSYKLGAVGSIEKANTFGKVRWVLSREDKPEGIRCTVVVRVDTEKAIGAPAQYDEFREFLGWVREACGRTLILEKAP